MWRSRKVARLSCPHLGLVLCLGQRPPEVAGGSEELRDLLPLLDVAVALGAGVEREPEHADRVGLPRPEERRRHREVLVDAGERQRLLEPADAAGLRERAGRLAVGYAGGGAAQHVADLVLREPGEQCRP